MSTSKIVIYDVFLLVLLGALGVALARLVFAGLSMFDAQSYSFQYFTCGSAASLLFAIYQKRGLMEALYFAALLSLVLSVFIEHSFVERLGNLTLFFSLACFSYYGIWRFLGRLLPFGKFVILGLAFWGIGFSVPPFLGWLLESSSVPGPSPFLMGTLGLGLGIGLETGEAILGFFHHRTHHGHAAYSNTHNSMKHHERSRKY